MIKIDFTKYLKAQDMIRIVMREKGLSEKQAIAFSINNEIYQQMLEAGYASIALSFWGHDDYQRIWDKLDSPIIEIELNKIQKNLIDKVINTENVDKITAITYFLLFTMDDLGYHI